MSAPQDLIDGVAELFPGTLLAAQELASFGGQAIKAAPPVAGLLDPAAADEAARLEPDEHGVQRADAEREPPAGSSFDALPDFVTVPGARIEQREDEQLGAAFLELVVGHGHLRPSIFQ